jgi:type I restriction enzyme S subunit
MMEYGAYPAYKPSNVGWLGDIPEHWMAKRLKFVIREPLKYGANEAAELTDPELPRYIRITDVRDDGSLREETFRSLPQDVAANYLLSDGDILLARSGATVGKSFIYKPSWGVAAYAGYLIRARISNDMNADFAYLFLQSDCYWQWLNSVFIQATIQNVSAEKYANLFIPIPPIGEQRAIARFLDFKTAQIDALIAKKKMLLDKLAEKRTALISHAVTKGLDPTVPMKESGVAWLGGIPAHWDAKRLKFVVSTFGGGTPNTGKPEYWNGDIPWVSPKDMKCDFIETTEDYLTEIGVAESATKIVPVDSVLIVVRSGILRHTIPVARNTVEVALNQDMKALVASERLRPGFIHWFISGLQGGLLPIWSKQGCTVESIEMDYMSNTVIPLPPVAEQDAILARILEITASVDAQAEKVTAVISSLIEYRSSLITHAVTGKIDLREFQIPQSSEGMAS